MTRALGLAVLLAGLTLPPAAEARGGLRRFLGKSHPPVASQSYLGGLRLAAPVRAVLGRVPFVKDRIRDRQLVQVSNPTLEGYLKATARGYLEVVVPAGKGHVFFRYGKEVFDFHPGGFRVGEVRAIGSERYGLLIPLSAAQEKRLATYLGRLKRTEGKELGTYDFEGDRGFHCVSWLQRLALDPQKGDLVSSLGGQPRDGDSMPRFARFLLRSARPVEAVVVYNNEVKSPRQLQRARLDLISLRQLRRDFADENGR